MDLTKGIRNTIYVIAIIIALLVVPTASMLAVKGKNYIINMITHAFTARGDYRLESLISLCLYLLIITVAVKFIIRR